MNMLVILSDSLAEDSLDDPRGRKINIRVERNALCFHLEFDRCPRSLHRELRNRFFDWFHQIEKLEHTSRYYGEPLSFEQDSLDQCRDLLRFDRELPPEGLVHVLPLRHDQRRRTER